MISSFGVLLFGRKYFTLNFSLFGFTPQGMLVICSTLLMVGVLGIVMKCLVVAGGSVVWWLAAKLPGLNLGSASNKLCGRGQVILLPCTLLVYYND